MDETRNELNQRRLAEVLVDYGRSPGKYPVRLGEPRELHAGLDTLTFWALGRLPKALESQAEVLREAAVLFIVRACFAPDVTHYQMFGLAPAACTPDALRARYRNLIRLTHPDMGTKGLPSNAAGALNRAQGVLSDTDLRRRYDEELAERQSNTTAAERGRVVQPDGLRRIEHRVTIAERWQSLKAQHPNMVRFGALATGAAVVAFGLLALALNSHNDDRVLISSRGIEMDGRQAPDRRQGPLNNRADGLFAAASRAAPSGAAASSPPVSQAVDPNAATARLRPETGPQAVVARAGAGNPTASTAPTAPTVATGNAVRGSARAAPVLADPAPTTNPGDSTLAGISESARNGAIAPSEQGRIEKTSRAIPTSNPSTLPPAAATDTRRVAARPDAGQESAPLTNAMFERPTAQAPRGAATASALSSSPSVATTSSSAQPSATTAANSPRSNQAPAPGTPVWNVDTPGAMSYLSELVAVLESPNAAHRTNAYLTQMKVKGSLFQPALKIMRDFSEIDVSRVDWSDTSAPGVLKVRGVVVLQVKSTQPPFNRVANFRLSAEFWGTPTGTVLAELNLREAE